MPARTARLVAALGLTCAMSLSWALAAHAQPPKPVITTPTPTALPGLRELVRTPAPYRQGYVTYLPLVLGSGGQQVTEAPAETFPYVVQPGDTLWFLALAFGRDLDTMACATRPLGPDAETLVPGETIMVPALADMCYTVTPGESLAAIAVRHGLSRQAIVDVPWNGFDAPPYTVQAGQRLLLPGVQRGGRIRPEREAVSRASDTWASSPWPDWPYGDGHFTWPVRGPISQYAHQGHWALDIAIDTGTPVLAADRGRVAAAGWSTVGYGFRVVIDHGNDYVTLYAHLSDIYVEPGEVVGKGQAIGASGANGNVTGPHLHFEIRDFGILTDPLRLLEP